MNKERNKRVQIRLHIYLICTITKRSKRQQANVCRFFAKIKQKNKQFTKNFKLGFTIFIILIYPLIFDSHHFITYNLNSAISSILYIEPIDIKICLLHQRNTSWLKQTMRYLKCIWSAFFICFVKPFRIILQFKASNRLGQVVYAFGIDIYRITATHSFICNCCSCTTQIVHDVNPSLQLVYWRPASLRKNAMKYETTTF